MSLFPSVTQPREKGYIIVTSDVGVAGRQSVEAANTIYSLPAQSTSSATELYSAQFASGGVQGVQYFTELNFVNTSIQSRSLRVLLVGNNGTPVSGITNPVSLVLAKGQQYRARGETVFDLPDPAFSSTLVEGSLVISVDGPGVIGDVTFGDPRSHKFMAALPLDGKPLSTLIFSQVAQGYGGGTRPYFTGIAVYNPSPSDVAVTIDVYSDQGTKTGTSTLTLHGRARVSRTLPELVPAITSQVRGYIRITTSGGPVEAFELFGDQSLNFLAAVPPRPITPS